MADITKKDLPWYEWLYTIDINWHIYNKFWYKKKQKKIITDIIWWRYQTIINQKRFRVHRIIGKVFIPNPDNKPQINHIDWNKSNNNIKNLEWCTPKENVIHAVKILWKDLWHWRWTKSKKCTS